MPHQCTGCGREFADGSKEMLSGCPGCGGTKFQFLPDGGQVLEEAPPEPPGTDGPAVAGTVGNATAKLRDFVDRGDAGGSDGHPPAGADSEGPEPDSEAPDGADAPSRPEDGAQSTARSEMVDPEELPGDGPAVGGAGRQAGLPTERPAGDDGDAQVVGTPAPERPDLSELREELNDQFEGIRIHAPGQYELNIMELYEREETIIALQENGRYVIEPPESWHGDGPD